MSVNHEKYTLVIVDEYSRMVENQNDVKVKQIRTDNGTKFRNSKIESFCDEKGIYQNFSSPYTPKQNGVAERKNRNLIEANRSIIVKRHDRTPYEIFRERIPDISYFHVFGCPVFIHNHKDHLGKFDAKADDVSFLGYLFNSKAFRSQHASTSSYPVAQDRWSQNQHIELVNIIGDLSEGMLTRTMAAKLTYASVNECLFADFLSEIKPKKLSEALKHPRWVDSLQEELNQFYRNKLKNDEHKITTKIKARMVTQGYSQEEGINYDETFAPVARMEAIRIFLAFATYMNFIVFQMDVKSDFLNRKLKEEFYVKQPPGFESSEFSDYVCKLDKALYGLKQAPKA
ncbi:retrovirus-related pol polyprotein from transposon TNT 1-94 [Tanacetum coccineum]